MKAILRVSQLESRDTPSGTQDHGALVCPDVQPGQGSNAAQVIYLPAQVTAPAGGRAGANGPQFIYGVPPSQWPPEC